MSLGEGGREGVSGKEIGGRGGREITITHDNIHRNNQGGDHYLTVRHPLYQGGQPLSTT